MKIATVIPLSKGIFKDQLTYFTATNISPGTLVTVPVRKGEIDALVIAVEEITNLKTTIKKSDFSLKKINKIRQSNFFLPEFIKACQKSAQYFITNPGQVFKEFTPKIILEKPQEIKSSVLSKDQTTNQINSNNIGSEKYALQDETSERLGFYKRTIREALAQKKSVFICFPSALDIDQMAKELAKGIEEHTFILHNQLTNNSIVTNWHQALISPKPIVILSTSLFLSLPRSDIKIFIIEQERSSNYKHQQRPFIDARIFIEHLAETMGGKLILSDSLLRTETIQKINETIYLPASLVKQRNKGLAKSLIITPPKKDKSKNEESIFSEELLSMIKYSIANKNRIVIISGRRGLYPITICDDCSTIVQCEICNNPICLHKTIGETFFLCHRCGTTKPAEDKCSNCGGWRLAFLGTGTEKIRETIELLFPQNPLFRIDSDQTTPKKAREEIKKFLTTKGSILVGTEMILRYLREPVEYSALVSIDSLFTIPDFRIHEKILHLVIETHKLATKHFIIQTKMTDQLLFEQALVGNLSDFFRNELKERRQLNYPPFSKLIKISCLGQKQTVLEEIKNLALKIKKYNPLVIPNLATRTTHYQASLILKLPLLVIEPELISILKNLPPRWLIDVDPESIL